jgi:hypothetical protein
MFTSRWPQGSLHYYEPTHVNYAMLFKASSSCTMLPGMCNLAGEQCAALADLRMSLLNYNQISHLSASAEDVGTKGTSLRKKAASRAIAQ